MAGLPEYEKTPTSAEKEAAAAEDQEKQEEAPRRVMRVLDSTELEAKLAAILKEEESLEHELAEIEERTAGAAVGLPQFKPGDDGKMMELVSQRFIRKLFKSPPSSRPLPDSSVEAIRRGTGITDQKELETVARGFRALQTARDIQNDIIRQYRAKGYAYVPLPSEDDDDDERYPPRPPC